MTKIAIVNRTNLINYGSVLQVFALYQAIQRFGYESEVVWESGTLSKNWDFRPNKIMRTLFKLLIYPKLIWSTFNTAKTVNSKVIDSEKVERFESFVEKHFSRRFYSTKDLKRIAKTGEYYKFVCGSDQVWSSTTLYVDPLMYLRFAPSEKRIAYAPSLGRDYIPDYNKRIMRRYIKDIPYVSVREEVGQKLIYKLTGRDVPVVLDPTLLLTKDDWNELKTVEKHSGYVLCYFLDSTSDEVIKRIEEICTLNNKTIINIGCPIIQSGTVDVINENAGPSEFLGLVEKADMIFTDSYHGMLFSIIYQRPFWSIARNYGEFDQSSRQKNVLSMIHLEDRYIDITNIESVSFEGIDYNAANVVLQQKRNFSIDYLKNALKA